MAIRKLKTTKTKSRIKRSKWCYKCSLHGIRKQAVRNSSGSYQSYCRMHKNEQARLYMKYKRKEIPGYGQNNQSKRKSETRTQRN